jgi:hypothetical protein
MSRNDAWRNDARAVKVFERIVLSILVPLVNSDASSSLGSSIRPTSGHRGSFKDFTAASAKEPTILLKSVAPVFSETHRVSEGEQVDRIEPAPGRSRG